MSDLFNPPGDGEIEAFDLNGAAHKRSIKNFRLRASIYGVLEEDDKILVQGQVGIPNYSLPGGAIEIGEKLEEALAREFKEETGLEIKPLKLLGVKDDFITFDDGSDVHSILIFYLVEKIGGALIKESNGFDSDEALFIPIEELKSGKIQRVFKSIVEDLVN
jgi:8-oxo-dGTP diphosphatase